MLSSCGVTYNVFSAPVSKLHDLLQAAEFISEEVKLFRYYELETSYFISR
jgi:hypothetical protein